jgi:nucleotide-binding universal stress UspA family protein
MTIRTILAPVRGDGKGETVLDHAVAVARQFGAHVLVVHARPRPEEMLPFGIPVSGMMRKTILDSVATNAAQEEARVRELFEKYCSDKAVPIVDKKPTAKEAKGTKRSVSVSWHEDTGRQAEVVALHGRLADLIVVPQPDDEGVGFNTLEAALFDSGRLVLVAPPKPVTAVGKGVAIAWKSSREMARAITAAMPFLAAADKVAVICAPPSGAEQLSTSEDLAEYLAWHDIDAEVRTFKARSSDVGEALLREAEAAGADVMLMGSFGQRLRRELVLGGVTRHVIGHAGIPLLMMH